MDMASIDAQMFNINRFCVPITPPLLWLAVTHQFLELRRLPPNLMSAELTTEQIQTLGN